MTRCGRDTSNAILQLGPPLVRVAIGASGRGPQSVLTTLVSVCVSYPVVHYADHTVTRCMDCTRDILLCVRLPRFNVKCRLLLVVRSSCLYDGLE